jgi:hypothetical protein
MMSEDSELETATRNPSIRIAKLEAARRQLDTAIELWFDDKDEISIHTLAFAAYEIIDVVSRKRNRTKELIFDSLMIRDEYRQDWYRLIRKPATFFKHADRDLDGVIDFYPRLSELFLMYSILGLSLCSEKPNALETAFLVWYGIQHPGFFTQKGREIYQIDSMPVGELEAVKSQPKLQFLSGFLIGYEATHKAIAAGSSSA